LECGAVAGVVVPDCELEKDAAEKERDLGSVIVEEV